MTVLTNDNRKDYNGDGVTTTPFSFPYYFLADTDLTVVLTVVLTGVETPQVLNTDYTVSGAGDPNGGFIGFAVAPPVGTRVTILREIPVTQPADFVENDPLPAAIIERGYDRLTMIAQQLLEKFARSLLLPIGSTIANLVIPGYSAGKFWRWSSIEEKLENADITGLGAIGVPVSLPDGGTGANHANVASLFNAIKQSASTAVSGVVTWATQALFDQGAAGVVPTAELFPKSPFVRGYKNKNINGDFQIWQRGAGNSASFASPANGYTADRFLVFFNGGSPGTHTHSCVALTQAEREAVKALTGSAPNFWYRWNQSVAGAGQTSKSLSQRIENLAQFQSQKLTVSFVAKVAAGAMDGNVSLFANYGSGGAPSASEVPAAAQPFTVTTVAQRFTFTFAMPDFAGKTFGTDGPHTSYLQNSIQMALNATHDLYITDWQLEFGEVATPFERLSFVQQLWDCWRYFWKSFSYEIAPAQNATNANGLAWRGIVGASVATSSPQYFFPRSMRVTPTMVGFNPLAANAQVRNFTDGADCSATAVTPFGPDRFDIDYTSNAGSALNEAFGLQTTADAEF